jgi:hypothetical protein
LIQPGNLACNAFLYSNIINSNCRVLSFAFTVAPTNGWGSGPAQYLIVTQTLNMTKQPLAITGSATPAEGSSQGYSVTNVPDLTYAWPFSSGWVQTASGIIHSARWF